MEKRKDTYKYLKITLGLAVAMDILVWFWILSPAEAKNPELYFLPVGQGDSSLVNLSPSTGSGQEAVQILIDGGPVNGKAQENLEKVLGLRDRYIDLVMISHPQLDHYGGLIEVLKNYEIGAVLTDGQTSENATWQELEKIIREKGIRKIALYAGDKIKYGDAVIDILSPKKGEWVKDLNDLSVVALLEYLQHPYKLKNVRMLFGGDISGEKEKELARLYDLDVDILKVSHHGSKFSSDSAFLKEASPKVAVIGVGKNSYGHPTKEALSRLASVGSQVYRTDENGIVKIALDKNKLKIYNQH